MTDFGRISSRLTTAAALLAWSVVASAADLDPTGVWQVVAYTAQDPKTGVITEPFGPRPTGSAIYAKGGHMSVLVTGRERASPAGSDAEHQAARALLLDSMYAYSGSYAMSGSTVTIHVESAWQPGWVGTDRVRILAIDGDTLAITTPQMVSPVDGKTYISVTRFRRIE